MSDIKILNFCDILVDNITVIKGFLELSSEKDNYLIVQARNELQDLTKNLTDFIDQIQKNL